MKNEFVYAVVKEGVPIFTGTLLECRKTFELTLEEALMLKSTTYLRKAKNSGLKLYRIGTKKDYI